MVMTMHLKDSKKPNPILKWLRFSGASVCVTVNPCHWTWIPVLQRDANDVWAGPQERTWRVSVLMLTVRIWIDDGSW